MVNKPTYLPTYLPTSDLSSYSSSFSPLFTGRLLALSRNDSSVHCIPPSSLHPYCKGEGKLTEAIPEDFHSLTT